LILTLLTKEAAKKLSHNVIPYQNISRERLSRLRITARDLKIQGWYHKHGLKANVRIMDHWKKLSELFGHEPLYYINFEYRNAVWAFEWMGEKFILYKSIRGTSIEVPPEFSVSKIDRFQRELITLLYRTR